MTTTTTTTTREVYFNIQTDNVIFPTDLGSSWAPAVVESQAELDLIENGDKQLSQVASFFIGGTANINHLNNVGISIHATINLGIIFLIYLHTSAQKPR